MHTYKTCRLKMINVSPVKRAQFPFGNSKYVMYVFDFELSDI